MTNFEILVKDHPEYVKKVLAHNLTRSSLKQVAEGSRHDYSWYNDNNDKSEMDFLNAEYAQPVLNNIEKKYLSDVIRPFKHNVKSIKKACCSGQYFIEINMVQANDRVLLPYFSTESEMYKGMKERVNYTLKELGL